MKRWYLLMAILGTTIVGYFVVKTYSPINFGAMWHDLVNQARQTTHRDLKSTPDVNDAPIDADEISLDH
jgi:hypothetical protein